MWSKSFWEVQAWIDNDDYEKKSQRYTEIHVGI